MASKMGKASFCHLANLRLDGGTGLNGKSILVYHEQVWDTLQFLRYIFVNSKQE